MKKADAKKEKRNKVFQNLSQVIVQFMGGKGYQPLTEEELRQRLSISALHEPLFTEVLQALASRGDVMLRDGRFDLPGGARSVISGILRVHPRGFGFLQPDAQYTEQLQDIFIPKHLTRNAVDGDHVEVLIDEALSPKGPEGRVVSVLKRGRTHLAGTVSELLSTEKALVHVPLIGSSRRVIVMQSEEYTLRVGDRIILRVLEWGGSAEAPIQCERSHYLGHISDPACDVPAAIEEFDLRSDFPSSVLQEAAQFKPRISSSEIKQRRDLREWECFTIDPDTAKDYDDALSVTREKDGGYVLGVHIADVSHYVRPGSQLDQEAVKRCNSTYFPGFCLPMLPHELSNELCSLKAGVNRLTLTVLMRFDKEGSLTGKEIFRSVIKSKKRFTYKEAKAVLDGDKDSPHKEALHLMVELCYLLKRKRHERGSIEFALPEVVVLIDEAGRPMRTERIEYDITHQLVEEFMLKANETVATHLCEEKQLLAFRVHEQPGNEDLKDFGLLARSLGFKLPSEPTNQDLQRLFEEAMATPFGPQLAVSYIRSMKIAYYSAANLGHYGLSLEYYCHFTSPIRRYVDLVVHRIVCGELHDLEKLEAISHACSEQERVSARAEQAVTVLKKLRLLQSEAEKGNYVYEGLITRIKSAGIVFEIPALMLEGFVHISELGNDYFQHDEKAQTLTGRRTGETIRMGSRRQFELVRLDLILGECRWTVHSDRPRDGSAPTREARRNNSRPEKRGRNAARRRR